MTESPMPGMEARIFRIIRQMLAKHGLAPEFRSDQPLHDAGLNSLDMVNLMLAVEMEFDLEIPQQQITPENFGSVAAIGRLVEALVPAA